MLMECEEMADFDLGSRSMKFSGERNFEELKPSGYMAMLDDGVVANLVQQRKQLRAGFENVEKTKEFMERSYFGSTVTDHSSLIPLNSYWVDLAQYIVEHGTAQGFLSQNIIYATRNHAEMITALAFYDLKSSNASYEMVAVEGRKIEITAGKSTNLIVFIRQIKTCASSLRGEISIAQRFFDPTDSYYYSEEEPDIQMEKEVEEFIVDKIYGCKVIVTNCSISSLEFQLLTDLPNGAIPLGPLDYMKSHTLWVSQFSTQQIEFFFYFPAPGQFSVFPASASRNGRVIAQAKDTAPLRVVLKKSIFKMENFQDILQKGSVQDIIKFCESKNILNPEIFKFESIYWMLQKQDFYQLFISLLRSKGIFQETVWQHAFLHADLPAVIEYLQSKTGLRLLLNYQIKHLATPHIQVDDFLLLEYHPLLSNRVHNFMNKKSTILNIQFKQTYTNFLNYLLEVPTLHMHHYMVWCYYLILQERIQEAIKIFQKIHYEQNYLNKPDSVMHLDYLAAYLDIYSGYPHFKLAREIAARYQNYPVISWKKLFVNLQNQLNEFDGDLVGQDQMVKTEYDKNAQSVTKEESLSFEIDKQSLVVYYQNISQIKISYYIIDLEVLFSRSPFLKQESREFSYVEPNFFEYKDLVKQPMLEKIVIPVPPQYAKHNLYIQLTGPNKTQSATYFSSSLKVHVLENYGQIKVTDEHNAPLSKIYVKCYAKDARSSEASFYRDGYTDIRGKFDYAMSSATDID